MKLVYPEFLFALLAISIPVIIHLFNFRKYKKVYFTNVRFLNEIQQETKSRARLKHLLVLACRILAILLIVLAFTQPYIPQSNTAFDKSDKIIGVYLDNSFSMAAINKNGSLLDDAKKRALEIAKSYSSSDQFLLLTNDFEAKHQRLTNRTEFMELLKDVKISPQVKNISEIISRQNALVEKTKNTSKKGISYLLSDFQKSISDVTQAKPDSSVSTYFIPLIAQQQNNIYIDSCWFSSPDIQLDRPLKLFVRVKNESHSPVHDVPVKLVINGQQKALNSVNMGASSNETIELSFTISQPGWQQASVSLKDNPITFDDTYFISFEMHQNIPILCINGNDENPYLNAIYGQNPIFKLTNAHETQLDYSSFSINKLIVLNELKNIASGLSHELISFVKNGGSLVVFPHQESALDSYNAFFTELGVNRISGLTTQETKVDKINRKSNLFLDVFEKNQQLTDNTELPSVHKYYSFPKITRSSEEALLTLQNGESFLSKYSFGKGQTYIFSTPLNTTFSNLPKEAICVPVIYNMALYSMHDGPLAHLIGKDILLTLPATHSSEDNVYHITNSNFDIIPEFRSVGSEVFLQIHNQIKEAGHYKGLHDKKELGFFSFNYDRKESDLRCFTSSELKEIISGMGRKKIQVIETGMHDLTPTLKAINQGMKLWKICIILALLFLGLEILLLRFVPSVFAWKTKSNI
jgi:hypothetical protein